MKQPGSKKKSSSSSRSKNYYPNGAGLKRPVNSGINPAMALLKHENIELGNN